MNPDLVLAVIAGGILVAIFALYNFFASGYSKKSSTVVQEKKKTPLVVAGPYSSADVAKHATAEDAWIIIDGKVYNITDFVDEHPGGDSILKNVGGDASEGYHGPQHPVSVDDVLVTYYIGDLTSIFFTLVVWSVTVTASYLLHQPASFILHPTPAGARPLLTPLLTGWFASCFRCLAYSGFGVAVAAGLVFFFLGG